MACSVKCIWSNMLFKVDVPLLIFYLNDLSIVVNGVLKSSVIVVLLSISPIRSVNISFEYLDA